MEHRRVHDDQLRQVHRYFSLDAFSRGAGASCPSSTAPQSSLNSALSAFAQLVAWRLKASLAIISLVDSEYQFPLADSSAYSPDSGRVWSHQNYDLWPGRANVSVHDLPCGKTVALSSSADDQPIYIVPDLCNDESFRKLPVVSGPPFLRFYAGAPIKSPEGTAIGSLFIVDKASRSELAPEEKLFLLETAGNAAYVMEMARTAAECQRRMKMDKGLDRVLQRGHVGKVSTTTTKTVPAHTVNSFPVPSQDTSSNTNRQLHVNNNLSELPSIETGPETSLGGKQAISSHHMEKDGSLAIFSEAADILYTALEIENNGGVLFLDLTNSESTTLRPRVSIDGKPGSVMQNNSHSEHLSSNKEYLVSMEKLPLELRELVPEHGRLGNKSHILASCTDTFGSVMEDINHHADFRLLGKNLVARLAEAYPDGTLWPFRDYTSTSAEYNPPTKQDQPSDCPEIDYPFPDYGYLAKCFPKARQIIFAPVRESSSAGWNMACFCWTTSENLNWSQDLDVKFCLRFGYTVVRELSKLDNFAAERQLKDFVNTISHELRSPLHGILASAELLDETRHDDFQKSLVDTITYSGRTLLHTINQVLDYNQMDSSVNNTTDTEFSKISLDGKLNSLIINDTEPTDKSRNRAVLDVYTKTNIAGLCEEVISGLWAGQHFRGITSTESTEFTGYGADSRFAHDSTSYLMYLSQPVDNSKGEGSTVEVLLDIQKDDWHFLAPRGALCRVILNIVGNALKYTENGWIRIKLETTSRETNYLPETADCIGNGFSTVTMTVTDSGKGISAEFLRSKLYTAFAQEDVMAQGTGLGLNLVRSIVTMLHGTINIESQLRIGTEVRVQIPLRRAIAVSKEALPPQTKDFESRNSKNSIMELRQWGEEKSIAIYEPQESGELSPGSLEGILAYYIVEWFGLAKVLPWSASAQGDITIVDEISVMALLNQGTGSPINSGKHIVIVLCNKVARYNQRAIHTRRGRIVEFVTKPVGPFKLAEALHRGLRRESEARGKFADIFSAISTARGDFDEGNVDVRKFSEYHLQSKGEMAHSTYYHQRTLSDEEITSDEESVIGFSSFDHSQFYRRRSDTLCTERPSNLDLLPLIQVTEVKPSIGPQNTTVTGGSLSKIMTEGSTPWRVTPTILLVDDNMINLQLLEAFMKKRRCANVRSAVNGQLAVEAVEGSIGFDIILMDISMPILNGFQATRAIRAIEASRQPQEDATQQPPQKALIIALTGLASAKDRAEAFAAGVDLYMIKPVSLRAVGRLLDEWEHKRGERGERGEGGVGGISEGEGEGAENGKNAE